jgi:hypothetical protein
MFNKKRVLVDKKHKFIVVVLLHVCLFSSGPDSGGDLLVLILRRPLTRRRKIWIQQGKPPL